MIKLLPYLREVKAELHKVSWPTREQTKQKTVVVVIVSIIIGLYIGLSDFVFQELIKFIIT
ncbi:MAG TPA: preprotein translocase subunit SecE [Candidatus Woesebacteria bacterium]|jgi:preprotein translocase subunit SecE|nr:preprotein translocase subunit SecE [Candidatus Woesebacteria bacterium]